MSPKSKIYKCYCIYHDGNYISETQIYSFMNRIENLLGKNTLSVAQGMMTSPEVPWFYLPITATKEDPIIPYGGSLSHLIFKESQGIVSPNYDVAFNILLAALDAQDQELDQLYRIRLGMHTRSPHPVIFPPHVDDYRPHRTGLFYLINTDGDTIIYKEKHKTTKYTESHRSSPVENAWFDFDGLHYHSAQTPIEHERRIVLTYNYTVRN